MWQRADAGGGVPRWIRKVPPHPAKAIFTENCFRHLPLHRGRLWRLSDVSDAHKGDVPLCGHEIGGFKKPSCFLHRTVFDQKRK